MKTLIKDHVYEYFIKNSRFLAYSSHVNNCDEAKYFIDKNMNMTATHNCWAFKIGSIVRFNDDNEPSGTAGKSIFQAIEACNVDQIVILVSRWYGGIKLGAGGLVRAYRFCAAESINSGTLVNIINYVNLKFQFEINFLSLLKSRLRDNYIYTCSEEFNGSKVYYNIKIPENKVGNVKKIITDITSGSVIWF